MKLTRLNNVIFPIWYLILLFPMFWLVMIPSNFIIDSLVVFVALKMMNIPNIKEVYKKSILRVFLFGFLADILGSVLIILVSMIPIEAFYTLVISPMHTNPFENIYSLLFMLLILAIIGYVIYLFNRHICFKKTDLTNKQKHLIALYLAIFTTPYLFLVPTQFIYGF